MPTIDGLDKFQLSGVPRGKREASGTGTTSDFVGYASVNGLSFQPTVVVLTQRNGNSYYLKVYLAGFDPTTPSGWHIREYAMFTSTTSDTVTLSAPPTASEVNWSVIKGGFTAKMPVTGWSFSWYAYE